MIPLHLKINNFMCYSNAEIDFTKFDSALIIGKINDNLDISNGSGKTTIFNAIEYCLFNECGDLKLDKIVQEGKKSCSVELTFNFNNSKYKIFRARTSKGTSSVQLFNLKDLIWEDVSGRRNSDTEDQIKKLIKVTNKSFRNTTHFVQRDFSGLTSVTSTKRKEILKEIFDLSSYSKLEKIANSEVSSLSKNKIKLNTLIESLNNSKSLKDSELETLKDLEKHNINISNIIYNINSEIKESLINRNDLDLSIKESLFKLNNFNKEEDSLNKEINSCISKINILNNKKSQIQKDLTNLQNKLSLFKEQENIDVDSELNSLNKEIRILSENKATLAANAKSLQNESLKFEKALNLEVCESCLQNVSSAHCEKLRVDIEANSKRLQEIAEQLSKIEQDLKLKNNKSLELNILKKQQLQDQQNKLSLNQDYNICNNNLINIDSNIKEINSNISVCRNKLYSILESKKLINIDSINLIKQSIDSLTLEINNKKSLLDIEQNKLNNINKQIEVCKYKIQTFEENENKLEQNKKELESLEEELKVLEYVSEAFSSKGIPSFIINNLLDDVQEAANDFCNKIKPGLQIQFVLQKENSSGNEVETLDIRYFMNGQERDYSQLSGAMKFNVTFSIKLALSIITQKLLGTEIKFFLFDEIDSPLDKFSANEFIKVIKEIQKDYKILLITHGDSLKDKFNTKLLVSQDGSGSSTIIQD